MTEVHQNKAPYTQYESWKRWDREPFGSYSEKQHYYFKKLLTPYIGSGERNQDFLELGFGNGALAGWLKATHPSISWAGLELQQPLVSKAQKAGFTAMTEIAEVSAKKQFDMIVALDVIEHLTDIEIEAFFCQASELLKPNGIVLTRTPNAGGPFGLPNQTGDPTHTTPISLSRLSNYLNSWRIEEKGDIKPLWEGKMLSALRNCLQLVCKVLISGIIRFAFAPQPKTLLASNLHLIFKLQK